jgi:hypothetical protein
MGNELNLNQKFQKNITVIKARFPQVYAELMEKRLNTNIFIEPINTDGDELNLKVVVDGNKGCPLTNRNTIEESKKLIATGKPISDADTIVYVGMGLGMGILTLLESLEQPPRILVLEYSPVILHSVLQWIDLTAVLAHPKVELFLGNEADTGDIYRQRLLDMAAGQVRIVPDKEYIQLFGEPFVQFVNMILEWIQTAKKIWQTMRASGELILSNTIANLPSILTGLSLGDIRGFAAGIPAVCIAAGPSLDEAYPKLRTIQSKVLLFACDSAVPGLLEHGIHPHVVVTTDMNLVNFEKIRPVIDDLRDTILVYGAGANPDNVSGYPSQRRIAVSAENALVDHWIAPRFGFDLRIPALTSVLHAALFSAMAMGAQPIALAGVDLSFAGNKTHANASVFEYKTEYSQGVTVEGVDGSMLTSTPQMIADKTQIEAVLARVPTRVINTSKIGAAIKGTTALSLDGFVEEYIDPASQDIDCVGKVNWCAGQPLSDQMMAVSEFSDELIAFALESRQQRKRIQTLFHKNKKAKPTKKLKALIQQAVSSYRRYEKKNGGLINMLNTIRLEEIQAVRRQESAIRNNRSNETTMERVIAEMRLLDRTYRSLALSADYVIGRLSRVREYLGNLLRHDCKEESIDVQKDKPNIDCARFFSQSRQFYQAEQLYRTWLAENPTDERVWAELLSLYFDFKMWRLAEKTIRKALGAIPDSEILKQTASEIDINIKKLKKNARNLIERRKIKAAYVCLKEYLAIKPDDTDARLLYEKISL